MKAMYRDTYRIVNIPSLVIHNTIGRQNSTTTHAVYSTYNKYVQFENSKWLRFYDLTPS